jgi:starch phosphorylase
MPVSEQNNTPIYSFLPMELEGVNSLVELALDLRWSWSHTADSVWEKLDPDLWHFTYNPWVVLQTVSRDKLREVLSDTQFRQTVDDLIKLKNESATAPAWFQRNFAHPS